MKLKVSLVFFCLSVTLSNQSLWAMESKPDTTFDVESLLEKGHSLFIQALTQKNRGESLNSALIPFEEAREIIRRTPRLAASEKRLLFQTYSEIADTWEAIFHSFSHDGDSTHPFERLESIAFSGLYHLKACLAGGNVNFYGSKIAYLKNVLQESLTQLERLFPTETETHRMRITRVHVIKEALEKFETLYNYCTENTDLTETGLQTRLDRLNGVFQTTMTSQNTRNRPCSARNTNS